MAEHKPGTYYASILFSLSLFIVLLTLVTMVIANPQLRASVSIFTVALCVGSMVILTMLFMRVLAAERFATRVVSDDSRFKLGVCPDTHKWGEKEDTCVLDTDTTLTISDASDSKYGTPIKHVLNQSATQPADIEVPTGLTAKELRYQCGHKTVKPGQVDSRLFLKSPYSALAPYCPS